MAGVYSDQTEVAGPPPVRQPSEPDAVAAVLRQLMYGGKKGVMMPHYTPKDWWECDVAHFTEARYLTEYEIKLSRSDFLADLRKERQSFYCRERRYSVVSGGTVERKHQMIRAGHGPKQFYFVCPEGLLRPDELPEYAGLIYVTWPNDGRGWRAQTVRPAERLKARKFDQQVIDHCRGVGYYRLLNLLARAESQQVNDG